MFFAEVEFAEVPHITLVILEVALERRLLFFEVVRTTCGVGFSSAPCGKPPLSLRQSAGARLFG
jgi:hypothetical protein